MAKANVKHHEDKELRNVYLSDILVDRNYHSRNILREDIIRRYENVYKWVPEDNSGGDDDFSADTEENENTYPTMPPLDVALIEGVLVLFDGFHRFAALKRAGMTNTEVFIHHGKNYNELTFLGARNNLTNGLFLTTADIREVVFKSYMKSKNNMKGKRYKSYREIAADFHGLCAHNTFRNWMKKDFPSVFKAMSSSDEGLIEFEPLDPDMMHLETAYMELSNVIKRYASIKANERKTELINACEETLAKLHKNTTPDYKRCEKDDEECEF